MIPALLCLELVPGLGRAALGPSLGASIEPVLLLWDLAAGKRDLLMLM